MGPNLLNLLKPKTRSRDVRGCLGAMFDHLLNKWYIDMKKENFPHICEIYKDLHLYEIMDLNIRSTPE